MFRLIVAVALLSLAMGARNTMFYRVETKTVDLTHFLKDPTKTAVVFADQETLKEEKMSELWKRLWNDAPLRFCIDKGADRLFHFKDDLQPPTMITGKLDRMEMETLKFFEGKETRLQDTYDEMETDLLTTLKVLGREDLDEIDFVVILGGFEGRFDRVLGHLDALMRANLMLPVPTMTLHGHDLIMVLPEGEWTLDLDRTMLTGTCGFAPLEQKKTMVTTTGFKWNLENEEMGFGKKISTSNEVESDQLKMHTDGALVFTVGLKKQLKPGL